VLDNLIFSCSNKRKEQKQYSASLKAEQGLMVTDQDFAPMRAGLELIIFFYVVFADYTDFDFHDLLLPFAF